MDEKINSIGTQRREYLKYANLAMATYDIVQAEEQINNFLHTIPDEDPEYREVAEKIKYEFDKIEKKGLSTMNEIYDETEKMNVWDKTEIRSDRLNSLKIEKTRDRIDKCWKVAIIQGLLND